MLAWAGMLVSYLNDGESFESFCEVGVALDAFAAA